MTRPKRQQLTCYLCKRTGSTAFTTDDKGPRCKGTKACLERQGKLKRPTKRGGHTKEDRAKEKAATILRLRKEGWTQGAIGTAVGLTQGRVSQVIAEHYAQLAEDTKHEAAHLRALELDRLDHLAEQLAPFAMRTPLFHPETGLPLTYRDGSAAEGPPSLNAVNLLRQLSESRRKLLGLDAPVETKHTGTVRHEHEPIQPAKAAAILKVLADVGALGVPVGSNN